MTRVTLETGSHGIQLQLEYGPFVDAATGGSITANTTSCKFKNLEIWFDTNGYHTVDSSNNLAVSGGWCIDDSSDGSSINTSGSVKLKELGCQSQPMAFGSSTGTYAVAAKLTGVDASGTMDGSKSWAVPIRPYHPPLAPGCSIGNGVVYCSGNQTVDSADYFWQYTNWAIIKDGPVAEVTPIDDVPNVVTSQAFSVDNDHRYQGSVAAVNSGGASPTTYSDYWYGTPSAPSGLTAERQATKTSVLLAWTNNAYWGTSFLVERSLNGGAWSQIGTTTAHSYTDTNVPLGSTASYRVQVQTPAGANTGTSEYSETAAVTYGWALPAMPATAVMARQSDAQSTLTLSGNQTNAALDNYWSSIDLQLQTDTAAFVDRLIGLANNTTVVTLFGLALNKRFRTQVRVVNPAGYSGWKQSNYLYTTPSRPTGLTASRASAASTTVNLVWTNNAPWAAQFIVERSTNGGSSWVQLGTAATNVYHDTLPVTSSALYRVYAQTPSPYANSLVSDTALVPVALISAKAKMPGVTRIYVGTDRVRKVAVGAFTLWTDGDE